MSTVSNERRMLLAGLCCCFAGGRRMAFAELSSGSPSQDVMRRYEVGEIGLSLQHGYQLVDAALERSVARYGPYRVEPVVTEMSVARLHAEVRKGDLVNVAVYAPVGTATDEDLIPIDIALDKGLNSYRVAFIHSGNQDRMDQVRDIADLRQLHIGIGEQWNDVPIYEHNKIALTRAKEYETLLQMLERGRFDMLPRPATGIVAEYNAYKDKHPSLLIEQHLLIHYPLGMYAFVSKSAPRVADRIRYGLNEMQKDGSFDRLFEQHFSHVIVDLRLPQRTLIELENPFLPAWARISALELPSNASMPSP